MAKQPRNQNSSSVMPVMIIGGIIVIALLAFSFRRMATSRTQTATPAQSASAPAPTETTDTAHEAQVAQVPRVKPDQLRDLIARNAVTVIDVRDADSYLSSHIPGALHIPMARIDGEVPYLPKGKPIVTYCT